MRKVDLTLLNLIQGDVRDVSLVVQPCSAASRRGRSCVGAVMLERARVVDLLRAVLSRDVIMESVQCMRAATHVDGPDSERRTCGMAGGYGKCSASDILIRILTVLTRSRLDS